MQDPAQYLISTDGLRTHKAYYSPEVYGTITGEGFKTAASAPLKDGGMDWSGRKVVTKDEKKIDAKVVMKKKVEEEKEEEKAVESRKGQLRKTESVDSKKVGTICPMQIDADALRQPVVSKRKIPKRHRRELRAKPRRGLSPLTRKKTRRKPHPRRSLEARRSLLNRHPLWRARMIKLLWKQ